MMMTGFEALSTASAVIQAISLAAEGISACKKVYDGQPTANDDLEAHVRRMSDALGRVQVRSQEMVKNSQSEHDMKLNNVADGCKTAAEELEKEIRFVTTMHSSGSIIKAIKANLRASRHRKKIERLEQSMVRYRQVMEIDIISHLCSRTDAIKLQQTEHYKNISNDVQSLVAQIAKGHTKLEDLIRAEQGATREILIQKTIETQEAINAHVTEEVQALGNNAFIEARNKSFLQSLEFPEMNKRYNDLMDSRDASFDQVFKSYEEMTGEDNGSKSIHETDEDNSSQGDAERREIDQRWAEFIEWLQSNDSLFCIRGKPGSGKSTLIKFIIDNENTEKLLHRWSPTVKIMSYLFWKIGSSPQNSIKGLLCSLVYQALDGNAEMVEHILQRFHDLSSKKFYDDWSIKELKTILYSIIEKDTRNLCIFIDRLDEICNKDGLFMLIQVIEEIMRHSNIKICVSSRSETSVIKWLEKRKVRGVLLEDLTRPDMVAFVHKELEDSLSSNAISSETHEYLTEELVWKAQGVFLWLHLATRSLITGIQNDDSENMLLSRLKELPSELEELYTDMWKRLNENNSIYRETAARYFRFVLHTNLDNHVIFPKTGAYNEILTVTLPTLFQIASSESIEMQEILLKGTGLIDSAKVQLLCEKTKLDVQNRCAGLLRVKSPSERLREFDRVGNADEIDLIDALFTEVAFIHRTAHDFLIDTNAGQSILKYGLLSENEVQIHLLRGLLCLAQLAHSMYGIMSSGDIIDNIIRMSEVRGEKGLQEGIEMLQIIEKLYDAGGIRIRMNSWKPEGPFLSYLTSHSQLDDFVISYIAKAGSSLLANEVLREACCLQYMGGNDNQRAPSARLIKALMLMGADPHASGVNRKQATIAMGPFAPVGTPLFNLLIRGILSVNKFDHYPYVANEVLKAMVHMAQTCPDFTAKSLMMVRVFDDREFLRDVRLLFEGSLRREGYFDICYEVDLKFLISCLLLELAPEIDKDTVDGSQIQELLPKIENPSFRIRLIIHREEDSDELICHQVSQGSAEAQMAERIFAHCVGSRKKPSRDRALENSKSTYGCLKDLVRDPCIDTVDFEPAVLSLASEGLGFCTLLEAGIIPALKDMEYMEKYGTYPLTTKKLKDAASNAGIV